MRNCHLRVLKMLMITRYQVIFPTYYEVVSDPKLDRTPMGTVLLDPLVVGKPKIIVLWLLMYRCLLKVYSIFLVRKFRQNQARHLPLLDGEVGTFVFFSCLIWKLEIPKYAQSNVQFGMPCQILSESISCIILWGKKLLTVAN